MSFFYISDETETDDRADSFDTAVLVVSGELDYSASPPLKERILEQIRAHKRLLVIDLSAVTFIDSMAIGVLVGSATRLRETGGSLRVVCAEENERVLRIFDIAGVASSIGLYRSREEARCGLATGRPVERHEWVAQASAAVAHVNAQPLPARPSGLAAARRYAVGATVSPEDHPAASRHSGGEIDKLA